MEEKDENKVAKPEVEKKEEKKVAEPKKEKKESAETKKKEEIKSNAKSDADKKKFNTTSKVENKESKNKTGIIIAVIAIVVIAIIVYMAFMVDSPTKAVNDMFRKAKTSTLEEDVFSNIVQGEDAAKEVQKLIFENLSWKIIEETKQENLATVEVEVTNKDFAKVMGNLQQKAIKALFNGENVGTENTEQYLLEELKNSDIKNVTTTHTINVEKKDGKWQVSENNDIVNILLPGVNDAIKNLTN